MVSNNKWHVVSFKTINEEDDFEVSVVPENWILNIKGTSYSYWPDYTSDKKITEAIRKCENPEIYKWNLHEIEKDYENAVCCSYDEATEKVRLVIETSDLEVEYRKLQDKSLRKLRAKRIFSDNDDESNMKKLKKDCTSREESKMVTEINTSALPEILTIKDDSVKNLKPTIKDIQEVSPAISVGGNLAIHGTPILIPKNLHSTYTNGKNLGSEVTTPADSTPSTSCSSKSEVLLTAFPRNIVSKENCNEDDESEEESSQKGIHSKFPLKKKLRKLSDYESDGSVEASDVEHERSISSNKKQVRSKSNKGSKRTSAGVEFYSIDEIKNMSDREALNYCILLQQKMCAKIITNETLQGVSPKKDGTYEGEILKLRAILPIEDDEELQEFNKELKKGDTVYEDTKKYIKLLVRPDDRKKSVNAVLSAFISNELGLLYSSKGQKGKKDFSKLELYRLMESIMITREFSGSLVKKAASDWLKARQSRIDYFNKKKQLEQDKRQNQGGN